MARPKKKGVDYFPHDCITGKTIFILEQKFGNDGYAFWFKLLEFLGTKEGHFLDCNEVEDMEFLQAKTKLSEITVLEILELLAKVQAIDRDLWCKKIVWSQRFVDGISDVYVNRRVEKPSKPNIYTISTDHNSLSGNFYATPTLKSTQSKVKEIKVNEINKSTSVLNKKTDGLKNKPMTKKQQLEVELPFKEQSFVDKWAEWIEERSKKKIKPYTEKGVVRTLNDLKKMSGGDFQIAIKIIDQSLAKGWQGLFELKNTYKNGTTHTGVVKDKPQPTGTVATGGFGQL